MKVLVVDDYPDGADALAALIEYVGHEVAIAYSGIEALAVAQRFAPDMVFLDIAMPEMDGYAVARVLRQTLSCALLIAHSALGKQKDMEDAWAAGFDRHLLKPVEAKALLALLQEGRNRVGP